MYNITKSGINAITEITWTFVFWKIVIYTKLSRIFSKLHKVQEKIKTVVFDTIPTTATIHQN